MGTGTRWIVLLHRWLGIGGCLLVLMWFLTGAVMLYVPYPKLTESEAMAGAPLIPPLAVQVGPAAAWASTGLAGAPRSVRLGAVDGRAAYRFESGGRWHAVWADTGRPIEPLTAAEAARAAEAFAGLRARGAPERLERDQWTVYRRYDPHRPLLRVELDDAAGSELYVSSRTGEIVLDTTRFERGWNWAGTVLHWVYFTPLRMHGEVWRQLVLWLAFGCLAVALTGAWLGITRARIAPRYRSGRITPFRGWKRWHHLLGLTAVVWTSTWLLSGWLSLTPMGMFDSGRPTDAELGSVAGIDHLDLGSEPALLRRVLAAHPAARELQWGAFGGRSTIELRASGATTLLDATGRVLSPLPMQAIGEVASTLGKGRVARLDVLARGDLYHYAHRFEEVTLPVVRATLAGGDAYYFDPASGRLLMRLDDGARAYRWLFNALHRLDVPPLEGHALWEVVMIVLLALGALLAMTSVVLALRRLRGRAPARMPEDPLTPARALPPRRAAH